MNNSTKIFALSVGVVASFILSTACTTSSPTTPGVASQPTATAPSPAVSGAMIAGTVSIGTSSASQWRARAAATNITVGVKGTSLTALVGNDGVFTLTGVPAIDVVLTFAGPGVNAALSLGSVAPDDRVQITVTVIGDTATLDSQERKASDNSVRVDGTIASVAGSCPSLTLVVRGVHVATSSATAFPGKTCGDISPGDAASVTATSSSGGVVVAAKVDVAVPPPPSPAPPPAPTPTPTPTPTVTMTGTVAGLSGSCPSLTFTASSVKIHTNASTTFAVKAAAI